MFLKIHNFLTNVQKGDDERVKIVNSYIHDQQPDCDIMLRLNYPLNKFVNTNLVITLKLSIGKGCNNR